MFAEFLWQVALRAQGTEAPVVCRLPGVSVLVTSQPVNQRYVTVSKGGRGDSCRETVVYVTGTREAQCEGNPHPLKGMLVVFQETGQAVESGDKWQRTSRGQSICPLKAVGHSLDSHKLGLMVV